LLEAKRSSTETIRMTDDAKIVLIPCASLLRNKRRGAEIEANRRLPHDCWHKLIEAGLFRMFVPKSHGGLDVDYPTSMEIIEALAIADGQPDGLS